MSFSPRQLISSRFAVGIARGCQAWLLISQMRNVSFLYAEGASNASTVTRIISVFLCVFRSTFWFWEECVESIGWSTELFRRVFLSLCLPLFPDTFFGNVCWWEIRDNPSAQNLCGRHFDVSMFSRGTNRQINILVKRFWSARKLDKSDEEKREKTQLFRREVQ